MKVSAPMSMERLRGRVGAAHGGEIPSDIPLTERDIHVTAAMESLNRVATDLTLEPIVPLQKLDTALYGTSTTDFIDRYFEGTPLQSSPFYERLKSGDLQELNTRNHAEFIHSYLQNSIRYGQTLHDQPEQTFSLDDYVALHNRVAPASITQEMRDTAIQRLTQTAPSKKLTMSDNGDQIQVPDEIHNLDRQTFNGNSHINFSETVGNGSGNYLKDEHTDYPILDKKGNVRPAQHDAFINHQTDLLQDPSAAGQVLLDSCNKMQSRIMESKSMRQELTDHPDIGATAVMALRQDNQITVANLGDSRAYLAVRDRGTGTIDLIRLTQDHEPGGYLDRQHIEQLGGTVEEGRSGIKIKGMGGAKSVGCARSFGHNSNAYPGLTMQPDIVSIDISAYTRSNHDVSLIVACDGICEPSASISGRGPLKTPSDQSFYKPILEAACAEQGFANVNMAQIYRNAAAGYGSSDNITVGEIKLYSPDIPQTQQPSQKAELYVVLDGHGPADKGHLVSARVEHDLPKITSKLVQRANQQTQEQEYRQSRSSSSSSRSASTSTSSSSSRDASEESQKSRLSGLKSAASKIGREITTARKSKKFTDMPSDMSHADRSDSDSDRSEGKHAKKVRESKGRDSGKGRE